MRREGFLCAKSLNGCRYIDMGLIISEFIRKLVSFITGVMLDMYLKNVNSYNLFFYE